MLDTFEAKRQEAFAYMRSRQIPILAETPTPRYAHPSRQEPKTK